MQQLEEKKYTPNRVNYNFDATSPYYIYITHRKSAAKKQALPVDLSDMPMPMPSPNMKEKENLFKLTEENLEKFSEKLAPIRSRISLIQQWRDKVERSRKLSSILKVFDNVDELLDGVMTDETLNFTNTLLEPNAKKDKIPKTTPGSRRFSNFIEKLVVHDAQTDLSFVTADDNLNCDNKVPMNESNFIRSPQGGEYVLQVAETYTHTDDENGLVFYETRLYSNPGLADK